jgi:hypothetical protein
VGPGDAGLTAFRSLSPGPAHPTHTTRTRRDMSLIVVLGAVIVAAFLTVREPDSDLTKILVGGWGTALGNVIGFYFGARSAQS